MPPASTIFILPMPPLALAQPLDGIGDPLGPGRVLLRFGDPVEIFALRRRRKAVEHFLRLGIGLERGGKLRMQSRWRLGLMLDLARRRGGFGESRRLADKVVQFPVAWQVVE